MHYFSYQEVKPSCELAVVINVGTEISSALAVASIKKHAPDMPVLIVNCSPSNLSKALMRFLSLEWNFDTIDVPLKEHGAQLDAITSNVCAEKILFVDSDAEIRCSKEIVRLRDAFCDKSIFGSGWLQPTDILSSRKSGVHFPVVYRQRPWMPCVMFRTQYIRAVLATGASFKEKFIVGSWSREWCDKKNPSTKPVYAGHSDTSCEIYWRCIEEFDFNFSGALGTPSEEVVKHYHGITRKSIAPLTSNATSLDEIEAEMLKRLSSYYPDLFVGFAKSINLAKTYFESPSYSS